MGLCQSKSANTFDTSSNPTKIEKVEELSAASEKEDNTSHTNQQEIKCDTSEATSKSTDETSSIKGSLPPRHSPDSKKCAISIPQNGIGSGFSSGTSTPLSLDGSGHSSPSTGRLKHGMNASASSRGLLGSSNSVIGLDKLIDDRRHEGDLINNIVHMEVPFGKPIEDVYSGIHDGPLLGSGISGLVRLCVHKETGIKYAVKCLDLGLVETEEGLQQLREEIGIMCQLDHPNIVRLEEVYESQSVIYLVEELCEGGELFDRLDEQPDYHYTEAQCAGLVKQILCSLRYIHSKGIIHRDLKLENFLFSNKNADSELKMIDFGLSKHFKFGETHNESVGTPYTVAPEVILGSYDERCDIWGIGVIAFLLLCGDPPFGGCGGPESLMQVRANILNAKFRFEPLEIWHDVSQSGKDFISQMLVTDPRKRPTAEECQKSLWFREWADKHRTKEDSRMNPNVVKALVNFKELSDMRKLLCEVLSFTLLPEQITDLRKEFEKVDTDGSGEISLAGLKQVLIENAGAGTLGALTEKEVEDIFNAMRIRKTETRIHWHEFIAAGLSQCKVDERNLRLAFDRVDSSHKGYIIFEDVMDLLGRDAAGSEEAMRTMWGDSIQASQIQNAQITYDDFLLLVKGQTREDQTKQHRLIPSVVKPTLDVLHEVTSLGSETEEDISNMNLSKLPSSPIGLYGKTGEESEYTSDEYPVFIEDVEENVSIAPRSPENQQPVVPIVETPLPLFKLSIPNLSPKSTKSRYLIARGRSRSVDDNDSSDEKEVDKNQPSSKEVPDNVDNDESNSSLVVNRKLYREHREFRIALLEASKRFEDEQFQRTRAELQEKQKEDDTPHFGAGLVMKHGHAKGLSSKSIRKLMMQRHEEQQHLVEKATRRTGRRDRRARKKTISDMSGMIGGFKTEKEPSNKNVSVKSMYVSPLDNFADGKEEVKSITAQTEQNLHLEIAHRKPTIPGKFTKTDDPFIQIGNVIGIDFNEEDKEGSEHLSESSRKVNSEKSSISLSQSDGNLGAYDDTEQNT